MIKLDSLDIWQTTVGLADQMADARDTATALGSLPSADGIQQVVVMGMGGSGIGGDVLSAIASTTSGVPVIVSKTYECPSFVGPNTLVLASSFSGETEETLEAVNAAHIAGAKMIALSTGGSLAKLAQQWSIPLVQIPSTIPQPRCAIGASSVSPIILMDRLGLLPGGSKLVDQAIEQVSKRATSIAEGSDKVANQIAAGIGSTIPHFHGGGAIGSVAALRWKGQINENPKMLAFNAAQPELSHNELAGWLSLDELTKKAVSLILLRHSYEHPQVRRRNDYAMQLLSSKTHFTGQVHAQGDGEYAQLMDLVVIGDFVSLFMSDQLGVDPGPIDILLGLKRMLADRSN